MKTVMNTLTKKLAILGIAGACASPAMADRALVSVLTTMVWSWTVF